MHQTLTKQDMNAISNLLKTEVVDAIDTAKAEISSNTIQLVQGVIDHMDVQFAMVDKRFDKLEDRFNEFEYDFKVYKNSQRHIDSRVKMLEMRNSIH